MTWDRLDEFKAYHYEMQRRGDLDPQYPALLYLAERFELNREQRFWLAWLFAITYSVPTVYYIYNEFPDYENVDVGRLQRWWVANKQRCLFQTDRLWIRSRNQFVPAFESYRTLAGENQAFAFEEVREPTPELTYRAAFGKFSKLAYFGRYSMFLYLEAVHWLTGFPMEPDELDVKNALSSRNGLCYALGRDDLVDAKLSREQMAWLEWRMKTLVAEMRKANPNPGAKVNVWNVETSLCAYKKLKRGKRWLNYYINRQAEEIAKMEANVPEGVDWSVLWDHRREHFNPRHLRELNPPGHCPGCIGCAMCGNTDQREECYK